MLLKQIADLEPTAKRSRRPNSNLSLPEVEDNEGAVVKPSPRLNLLGLNDLASKRNKNEVKPWSYKNPPNLSFFKIFYYTERPNPKTVVESPAQ